MSISHVNQERIWLCDVGQFTLPDDLPVHFRKDGWFDHRRTDDVERYITAMSRKYESMWKIGKEHLFRAKSFKLWLRANPNQANG